ncbi:hypothetical protein BDM02DRAFT_3193780 [Thelephora ganbajun]|uniref:Uncharacterized protein n=1 Tax=Thelephora ganbajun TaxID=370292 RepID=A0ACB6YXY2_THEGA|nr:hypothetical protein BDM02DRAFT_3193780 [Thelephora ganbajun]
MIEYLSNLSNQLELQWVGLLALHENICLCNTRSDLVEVPIMTSPSLSPVPPQDREDTKDPEGITVVVSSVPEENMTPIPVLAPGPSSCLCCPHCVQESTTMLQVITQEEEHEIEDCLVNTSIPVGSESNETSDRSCIKPVVELTLGQSATLSPEVRGYCLLSMMRVVMMMLNATVFSHLCSYDFVGGELQLVFPISQEDFDSLMSGEMSAEVHSVTIPEVV